MTASASGCEKSGLSSNVYAKSSTGASIASCGDAWKVGSGRIVMTGLSVLFGSDPRTSDYLLTLTDAVHLVTKRCLVSAVLLATSLLPDQMEQVRPTERFF